MTTEWATPWNDGEVACAQRSLVDRQLQQDPLPQHLRALAAAVRSTECLGQILEVGCGSGYGREVLDREGVPYASYAGVDISVEALGLARERYPESRWALWDERAPFALLPTQKVDTVVDGSCVLHVEDWRAHLRGLCAASRRWVILHRLPVHDEATVRADTDGYGKRFPAWLFSAADIRDEMERHGFSQTGALVAHNSHGTLTFARPRHYATYSDKRYLTRLEALYRSMLEHCAPFRLHVLAWDDEVVRWADNRDFVMALPAPMFFDRHPELHGGALPGPPRTQVEHYWTCGPTFIADVMEVTAEPVTYVDADIMFHSSPEPVFAEVGDSSAAVFPHNFADECHGLPGPTVQSHLPFGRFNVGLVHFVDPKVARDWANDCRVWCYDRIDPPFGEVPIPDRKLRYGDQKFLDEWPARYGARVIEHPGACLGPWAIHTRALDTRGDRIYFGNRPLVAYHYSSLRELPDGHSVPTRPEYRLSRRQEEIVYGPYYRALDSAKATVGRAPD